MVRVARVVLHPPSLDLAVATASRTGEQLAPGRRTLGANQQLSDLNRGSHGYDVTSSSSRPLASLFRSVPDSYPPTPRALTRSALARWLAHARGGITSFPSSYLVPRVLPSTLIARSRVLHVSDRSLPGNTATPRVQGVDCGNRARGTTIYDLAYTPDDDDDDDSGDDGKS